MLGVLSRDPPLFLCDMLLVTREGSGIWFSPCGLFSWVVLLFLECGSFYFVPCLPPFLGALVYL
jgi:hypothetical protein